MTTTTALPTRMRAAALSAFGPPSALAVTTVPVPAIGPGEVLVRLRYAGVGSWDAFEREGGYAAMLGLEPSFPYVPGSEGAGEVAAVGDGVEGVAPGDLVLAVGFLNPRGGAYAEYVAADATLVAAVPHGLGLEEAAALGGVGLTALRGLDVLEAAPGDGGDGAGDGVAGRTVLVHGASGGIGHAAVQLARGGGARVIATASGEDGVELARHLGAEVAVDGHAPDAVARLRAAAPAGVDAALLTVGGPLVAPLLELLGPGARAAYPNGTAIPEALADHAALVGYNGEPDGEILARVAAAAALGALTVNIDRVFDLADASAAHEALARHHLGKLVLRIDPVADGARAAHR